MMRKHVAVEDLLHPSEESEAGTILCVCVCVYPFN